MKITFSPIRHNTRLSIEKKGETLVLNDVPCDFSGIADGEERAAEDFGTVFLADVVRRVDGTLHLTLLLPHGASAPRETLFPKPRKLTKDGPIALPPYAVMEEGELDMGAEHNTITI